LTLTTNGSQLARFAGQLYAAGVRRVNVSLDTLDADKFARVTRWGRLKQVLEGIDAAQAAGLRVKINAVALKGFNEDELLTLKEMRETLAQSYTLTPLTERTGGPARYVQLNETGQKIGFITPLTHNFCESCNRVRLTCTGELYMCLGQEDMADLRAPLRDHPGSNAPLEEAIRAAINLKPKGHDFDYSRQTADGQVSRHMSHTGG